MKIWFTFFNGLKNFADCIQLLAAIAFFSFFFVSCKKDFVGADNRASVNAAHSPNEKAPAIIVHTGSSIQSAVNAAQPGDIIQIEPGTYKEAIIVNTANLQLIGTGDGVIIENPDDEENGIKVNDAADGFVLKNVTVENFEENGVLLTSVDNFVLSHVTTIDNGEYGLFPVHCNGGVIEHCTSIGHDDTGIYVGQSSNVEINLNNVYGNVQGIEIENCSNVSADKNQCYDNTAGILVTFLPGLTSTLSANITVSNNHVYNNNHANFSVPDGGFENFTPSGTGILVIAGTQITVNDNNISGNNTIGVAMVSGFTLASLTGVSGFITGIDPIPHGNRVVNNVFVKNGTAPAPIPLPAGDILWDGPTWGGTEVNVCWKDNIFNTSFPALLSACN